MAFGLPKVSEMTAQLDERFQQLIAKLDEILAELRARNHDDETGGAGLVTLAVLGFAALLLIGGFAFCDLLIDDQSEENDRHLFGRVELVSHDYCAADHDGCYDGWGGGWGGGSDGNSGGEYEGGRGGSDYDGDGDGNRCRNFCFYGIPAPEPGEEGNP